jgi:hypothetical protein
MLSRVWLWPVCICLQLGSCTLCMSHVTGLPLTVPYAWPGFCGTSERLLLYVPCLAVVAMGVVCLPCDWMAVAVHAVHACVAGAPLLGCAVAATVHRLMCACGAVYPALSVGSTWFNHSVAHAAYACVAGAVPLGCALADTMHSSRVYTQCNAACVAITCRVWFVQQLTLCRSEEGLCTILRNS